RVTDLGGLAQYYMDMRPYLSDPDYWEENFGPYLQWLRLPGDTEGIYGLQNQLTVTGAFIHRTLSEQAGAEVPSDTNEQVPRAAPGTASPGQRSAWARSTLTRTGTRW